MAGTVSSRVRPDKASRGTMPAKSRASECSMMRPKASMSSTQSGTARLHSVLIQRCAETAAGAAAWTPGCKRHAV